MIIKSQKSKPLQGEVTPPADKSISHRAVIFSALSKGVSNITNLLLSEDIKVTTSWAKQLGVIFIEDGNRLKVCSNIDINNKVAFANKVFSFYLGNSGTSVRLLMGVMTGLGAKCLFYGDCSLQKRPMLRVIKPLSLMGARFLARDSLAVTNTNYELLYKQLVNDAAANNNIFTELCGISAKEVCYNNGLQLISNANGQDRQQAYLPVVLQGGGSLKGINYEMPMASAQVKSAVLLAGLFTTNRVTIKEAVPTRNHTENMLLAAGVKLDKVIDAKGVKAISLPEGNKILKPYTWQVPGDFSSAAFIIVAALLVPDSKVLIKAVNLNPLRTGLLQVLQQMGANLKINYKNQVCGEPFGDIEVNYTKNLNPIMVNKELVPLMIDEFPILACLLSLINGESKFLGVSELRYKESDRILALETNLNKLGVVTKSSNDSLTIYGNPNLAKQALTTVAANLDHRIAMAFLVLGLIGNNGIVVEEASTINTSFPGFVNTMQQLGANINKVEK